MWPKQIVIVRHAESEGNVIQADDHSLPETANHQFFLTPEKGRQQATITGQYLQAHYQFDACFASTFRRTQETLSLMYPGVAPIIDARLDEVWRGIWYTMPKAEIEQHYPAEARTKKREGWYHYRAPGGQSGQDVDLMIYSFLADLREFWGGQRVLIVGHGTWLIYFWRLVGGFSLADGEKRYHEQKFRNASVTVFEPDGFRLKVVVDNYLPREEVVKSA